MNLGFWPAFEKYGAAKNIDLIKLHVRFTVARPMARLLGLANPKLQAAREKRRRVAIGSQGWFHQKWNNGIYRIMSLAERRTVLAEKMISVQLLYKKN
jgi:hypothetical protein